MVKEKNKDLGSIMFFRESVDLRKKWRFFLSMGILLIILGILAVIYANWSTLFTVELLGGFLVVGGVLLLVNAFGARAWKGVTISTLLGILNIVVGGFCIFKPLVAASGITLLLAAFFFVGGLFRMITALSHRFDYSGLWFVSGLIAVFLGVLIVAEWPSSELWVIGLFVGIDLIINGYSWVAVSWAARKQMH